MEELRTRFCDDNLTSLEEFRQFREANIEDYAKKAILRTQIEGPNGEIGRIETAIVTYGWKKPCVGAPVANGALDPDWDVAFANETTELVVAHGTSGRLAPRTLSVDDLVCSIQSAGCTAKEKPAKATLPLMGEACYLDGFVCSNCHADANVCTICKHRIVTEQCCTCMGFYCGDCVQACENSKCSHRHWWTCCVSETNGLCDRVCVPARFSLCSCFAYCGAKMQCEEEEEENKEESSTEESTQETTEDSGDSTEDEAP